MVLNYEKIFINLRLNYFWSDLLFPLRSHRKAEWKKKLIMDSFSKPESPIVFKTFCSSCKKNTFAFDYKPACLKCGQLPLELSSPLENPIESNINHNQIFQTAGPRNLSNQWHPSYWIVEFQRPDIQFLGIV